MNLQQFKSDYQGSWWCPVHGQASPSGDAMAGYCCEKGYYNWQAFFEGPNISELIEGCALFLKEFINLCIKSPDGRVIFADGSEVPNHVLAAIGSLINA